MSMEIVIVILFLLVAFISISSAIKMHRNRRQIREAKSRLAHEVHQQATAPYINKKMGGPDLTWHEMRNEVRRRRRSAPRSSPHMYQFKFQVGKQ